jgi:hypothetical protein
VGRSGRVPGTRPSGEVTGGGSTGAQRDRTRFARSCAASGDARGGHGLAVAGRPVPGKPSQSAVRFALRRLPGGMASRVRSRRPQAVGVPARNARPRPAETLRAFLCPEHVAGSVQHGADAVVDEGHTVIDECGDDKSAVVVSVAAGSASGARVAFHARRVRPSALHLTHATHLVPPPQVLPRLPTNHCTAESTGRARRRREAARHTPPRNFFAGE